MRILITGSSGMLASALIEELQNKHDLILVDKKKTINHDSYVLDITNFQETYTTITKLNPELIIHTAAYTQVDDCEDNQELAFKTNVLGTRNIALSCQRFDATMLNISTDYVFNGKKTEPYTEYDKPDPISFYGLTKYYAENQIKDLLNKYYIVRTSWIYGNNSKNFVQTILDKAKYDKNLSIVNDQIGSPTYINDLANAISDLISTGLFGTWHITNSGVCSWFEFAEAIVKFSNIKDVKIAPISSEKLERKAKRPKNSVLDNLNWRLQGFKQLRHWQEALKNYLND